MTQTRRNFLAGAAATPAALAAAPDLGDKKVRIGVIGGNFGRQFFWHLHPNSTVVAVCDVRADRLSGMAKLYRCENTYKDFASFLQHPGMDAVAVFTPAPTHVYMAVEAMKAGKHVISAVPAGWSVEGLEELLEISS